MFSFVDEYMLFYKQFLCTDGTHESARLRRHAVQRGPDWLVHDAESWINDIVG